MPFKCSLIFILILVRLGFKVSRIIIVLVYFEVVHVCILLKLSSNLKYIPPFVIVILVINRIIGLIIIVTVTCKFGNDRRYNYLS